MRIMTRAALFAWTIAALVLMSAQAAPVPEAQEAVYEGDRIVDQKENLQGDGDNRGSDVGDAKLWPEGVVAYVIDPSLASDQRKAIQEAFSKFQAVSCVRFIRKTEEPDWLEFDVGPTGRGCIVLVKRVTLLDQEHKVMNKFNHGVGCIHKRQSGQIHEILYALGFYHDMARKDRDKHISMIPSGERLSAADIQWLNEAMGYNCFKNAYPWNSG